MVKPGQARLGPLKQSSMHGGQALRGVHYFNS